MPCCIQVDSHAMLHTGRQSCHVAHRYQSPCATKTQKQQTQHDEQPTEQSYHCLSNFVLIHIHASQFLTKGNTVAKFKQYSILYFNLHQIMTYLLLYNSCLPVQHFILTIFSYLFFLYLLLVMSFYIHNLLFLFGYRQCPSNPCNKLLLPPLLLHNDSIVLYL